MMVGGLGMDAVSFAQVCDSFQKCHAFFAVSFGRKQWREHSRNYLQALSVGRWYTVTPPQWPNFSAPLTVLLRGVPAACPVQAKLRPVPVMSVGGCCTRASSLLGIAAAVLNGYWPSPEWRRIFP